MKKIAKGFTLVELMIVVAIIGILAAIAIPNFIKYQLRSKFSEASSNVEGLRKAQEALSQGERKVVINGTLDPNYVQGTYHILGGALMPAAGATPGTAKFAWLATDLYAAQGIDWQIEGATYFNYQVSGCGVTGASNSATCYTVGAAANIDGTGANGEVALVKMDIAGTASAAVPTNVKTAFPGTDGSCLDKNNKPIYGMPCTLTGPDVF